MSEHDWLIGKEFIDARDSGRHVVRVIGISQTPHYVSVAVAEHVDLGLTTRLWERNAYVIEPLILLHELNKATRPMVIDMMDREEHKGDDGETFQDVADVIQALNNVKDWQECGAWRMS